MRIVEVKCSFLKKLAHLASLDPKFVWRHYDSERDYRVLLVSRRTSATEGGRIEVNYCAVDGDENTAFTRELSDFLGDVKTVDGYKPQFRLMEKVS